MVFGDLPAANALARSVVMDSQNFSNVFVLDYYQRVFGSFNEGASWTNLTANLTNLCSDIRCIEIFSPTNTPLNTVLVAGGQNGIFQLRRPGGGGTLWTALSTNLPHALFLDLHYDYVNNVLVAGSLGRGAWTLTQFFRGGGGNGLNPSAVPNPLPTSLNIQVFGPNLVLSWPEAAAGYTLEVNTDLTQPDGWWPVEAPVTVLNGLNIVAVPLTPQNQFFRLEQ